MSGNDLTIRFILTNAKAIRALEFVAEVLEEAAESQPWNEDLRKAQRRLRYAVKRLRPEVRSQK